jgi:hypothetical protein
LQRFEQSIAELDNNEQLKKESERWKLHQDSYQSQGSQKPNMDIGVGLRLCAFA